MCCHFDFNISMYEKRSNQLHIQIVCKSFTLIYHTFSAYTKTGQIKPKYFSFQFQIIIKNQFNLIYGSNKRACKNYQLVWEISQNIFFIISNYIALSLFCILHVKKKKPKPNLLQSGFTLLLLVLTYVCSACQNNAWIILVLWFRVSSYPSLPVKFLGNFIHTAHVRQAPVQPVTGVFTNKIISCSP